LIALAAASKVMGIIRDDPGYAPRTADTRIVAMSARCRFGRSAVLDMMLKPGADATLVKPFTCESLIQVVRTLMPVDFH
jgi:CheY-like chemotaxis protein